MQKSKTPRATTYTLEASSSHRLSQHNNNHDQTATTTSSANTITPCTPRGKVNPLDTQQPIEEQEDQPSGLNTSGANSTIHEYINMLSASDRHVNINTDKLLSEISSPAKTQRLSHSSGNKKKQNSLELKLNSQENFAHLVTIQHSVTTRAKLESPDTLKDLKNLIKTPEAKKMITELVTIREKGKEPVRTGPPLKSKAGYSKSLSKQSISKITASFLQNQKSAATLGNTQNATAVLSGRRLPTENSHQQSKDVKAVNVITRLATSPHDTDRDVIYEISSKPGSAKHLSGLGSPTVSEKTKKGGLLASPQAFIPDKYQVSGGSRRDQSLESPNQSLRNSLKLTASVSRAVKALVTSRGDLSTEKKNMKNLFASPKQQNSKDNKQQELNKGEKTIIKPVKVDIVEVNLPAKTGKKKKEQKVDEYIEKLDEIYEKLRKTIEEKKGEIVHNDLHIKALENLNTYLSGTQNLLQASKSV